MHTFDRFSPAPHTALPAACHLPLSRRCAARRNLHTLLAIGIGESLGAGGYERGESESLPYVRRWQELREGRVGKRGIGEKNN